MMHLTMPEEYLGLWDKYVLPVLGSKVHNQFVRLTDSPLTEFGDTVVWPHLHSPWNHICIADNPAVRGRNPRMAEVIREEGAAEWAAHREVMSLFTNVMTIPEAYMDDRGEEQWRPAPMERCLGGLPHVFTIEYDVADVGFLQVQLGWCRSAGKKPTDAAMGRLYRHFSQYADFRGLNVCWSGNKSLHIHVVMDSGLAVEQFGLDRRAMRDGFIAHWYDIEKVVREILAVPDEVLADASLRLPESFRRLPWGSRVLTKSNLLGIPAGTRVPQICLWERMRSRRADDANLLFFRPEPFLVRSGPANQNRRVGLGIGIGNTVVSSGPLTEDDRVYCEDRLRDLCQKVWGPFPRVYRLEYVRGGWQARFHNSKDDANPSSIMKEGYAGLFACGRDADTVPGSSRLPLRLGILMEMWLKQRHSPEDLITWIPDPVRNRVLSDVERAFQGRATSLDVVGDLCREALRETIAAEQFCYVRGPEGSGKTRGVMMEHDTIMGQIGGLEKVSMYAFGSYEAAEEKAREFNAVQGSRGYHAVVIGSWEREYREVCRRLRIDPLTAGEALEAGYGELWGMVEDRHPRAVRALEERHAAVWREIGRKRPVLMTQHGVMQYWTTASRTRQFWNREFFRVRKMQDRASDAARYRGRERSLKVGMQLGLAIYDEVSAADLLDCQRESVVEWVHGLKREYAVWRSSGKTLEAWEAWEAYRSVNPFPVDPEGVAIDVDFRTARRIAEGARRSWTEVVVQDSGEYSSSEGDAERSIYQQRVGQRWLVRPRDWWSGLARRVCVLTTEALPTLIAASLPEATPLGWRSRKPWRIIELETPGIERDAVRLAFDRETTAGRVDQVVERFRQEHGQDIMVISNRAGDVSDATNHTRAKGSNSLMDRRIMQTMLHMSVDEHELHEVLNGYLGVDVCVRLRHADTFNQSAGRNLGFRKRSPDAEHWLVMSPSLWGKVDEVLCRQSRYDFRVWLGDGQVREIRRRVNEVGFAPPAEVHSPLGLTSEWVRRLLEGTRRSEAAVPAAWSA